MNLFINYFLLISVAKFLYIKINKKRLILGEILGAIYSFYIFLPNFNFIISFLIKLLMATSLILVTFGFKNKKSFLKTVLCFFAINFAFSGLMFALWCTIKPRGMLINNGVVYFNISPIVLIVSTVTCYFVLEFINKTIGKKSSKDAFAEVKINCFGNSEIFKVKIDTGCNLKEPFSGIPVIIIKKDRLKNLIPEEILDFNIESASFNEKIRIIPFNTIHENGLLPSIKAKSIELLKGEKKEAYIAFCENDKITNDFDGLIGEDLI